MHVAIVNGLNKKLGGACQFSGKGPEPLNSTYRAATTVPLHLLPFRGEVKSADDPASPESAIVIRALALHRSTAM